MFANFATFLVKSIIVLVRGRESWVSIILFFSCNHIFILLQSYSFYSKEKNQLKELCIEQEKQLEALEGLLKDKESKEITWTKER